MRNTPDPNSRGMHWLLVITPGMCGAGTPYTQSMTVPAIPGEQVPEGPRLKFLRAHVKKLCHLQHTNFPGAQPVSFSGHSMEVLKSDDYWVCEKSDGQRVLVLITVPPATTQQEVYLIDRKNNYHRIFGLHFPNQDYTCPKAKHNRGQRNQTLLDGELVVDRTETSGTKLRLLLFDCIVLERKNMATRPLRDRYCCLLNYIYTPYVQHLKQTTGTTACLPFEVMVKSMNPAYEVETVIRSKFPTLQHASDGLIFTCPNGTYVHGTDPHIIKWKPSTENTIDFKLCVRFPLDSTSDRTQATCEKPFFELYFFKEDGYEYFDWFEMPDDEWKRWRESGEQLDDQIVECAWHPPSPHDETTPTWHLKRMRNDKSQANHYTTVNSVIQSIADGVDLEQIIQAVPEIRAAWKEREKKRRQLISIGTRAREIPSKGFMWRPPLYQGGMPAFQAL